MTLDAVLARSAGVAPGYADVGATRAAVLDGAPLPAGWHHLRARSRVGHGPAALAAAGECVRGWGMHRGAGITITADAPRADVGVTVVAGIGVGLLRLAAPCRVLWTVDEPGRRGFGYGTLPGHPELGEEAFVVDLDAAGDVWFTLVAFSRPARWYTRLAGPAGRLAQRLAADAYARAVRRACAATR